ncbi:MAG: hypothetical protein WDW36_003992 [Sanguina aurantia]
MMLLSAHIVAQIKHALESFAHECIPPGADLTFTAAEDDLQGGGCIVARWQTHGTDASSVCLDGLVDCVMRGVVMKLLPPALAAAAAAAAAVTSDASCDLDGGQHHSSGFSSHYQQYQHQQQQGISPKAGKQVRPLRHAQDLTAAGSWTDSVAAAAMASAVADAYGSVHGLAGSNTWQSWSASEAGSTSYFGSTGAYQGTSSSGGSGENGGSSTPHANGHSAEHMDPPVCIPEPETVSHEAVSSPEAVPQSEAVSQSKAVPQSETAAAFIPPPPQTVASPRSPAVQAPPPPPLLPPPSANSKRRQRRQQPLQSQQRQALPLPLPLRQSPSATAVQRQLQQISPPPPPLKGGSQAPLDVLASGNRPSSCHGSSCNSCQPPSKHPSRAPDGSFNDPDMGRMLMVRNLPFAATADDVAGHFCNCANLASVQMSRSKTIPGRPPSNNAGYCHVTFKTREDAAVAMTKLQTTELVGHETNPARPLVLERMLPRDSRPCNKPGSSNGGSSRR